MELAEPPPSKDGPTGHVCSPDGVGTVVQLFIMYWHVLLVIGPKASKLPIAVQVAKFVPSLQSVAAPKNSK